MEDKFYPIFASTIFKPEIENCFSASKKKALLERVNERRLKRKRKPREALTRQDYINEAKRLLSIDDSTKNRKKFFIDKEVILFIAVTINGTYIKVSTGMKISPVHFDLTAKMAKKSFRFWSEFNRELSKILNILEESYQKTKLLREKVGIDEIKELMHKAIEGESYNPKNPGFWEALEEFIIEKERSRSRQTVERYSSLRKALKAYEKHYKIKMSFEAIDERFESEFRYFSFNHMGHVNNTHSKSIRSLKTFMKWSVRMEYTSNVKYQFYTYKDEYTEVIFLNEEEIELLENVDLTDNEHLQKIRDGFLFLCYTCQRYGDLYSLTYGELVVENGVHYWENFQNKGRRTTKVVIPLTQKALDLINKQHRELKLPEMKVFKVPHVGKFNDQLKDLCKLAGIDKYTVIRRNAGNKERITKGPKWEFITSHCGRRTGISYLLSKGIDIETVRRISGHADFRAMKPYMSLNREFLSTKINEAWDK